MKSLIITLLATLSLTSNAAIYCHDKSQEIIIDHNAGSSYSLRLTTSGARVLFEQMSYRGGRHTYTFENDEIKLVIKENFDKAIAEGTLFYSESQSVTGLSCCSEGSPAFNPRCM